ncbi:MAG: PTS sugar transporter subunit IIA [Candidatus Marinimicrobia bacterium]|nr:PTS sugar transporter subunit IIA [Candidatus Neomarinimicrobiota bacterium]
MNLSEILHEECIQVELKPSDKISMLREIVKLSKRNSILNDKTEDEIFQGLIDREKLGSTGFGNSIAIPHCALEGISDFVVGIITVPDGIDFESLDGKKTKLFVFIIVPKAKRNEHIRLLSKISSVLRVQERVNEILLGKNSLVVRESFLRHTVIEEEIKETKEYSLFYVVIQLEERFNDILEIFTETDDCSVSVIEANNASRYLYSLPLFSSFWSDKEKGFSRVIIAGVKKSLSNDVLRRINMIIEELEEKSGIMVLVHDVFYLSGSLNI